MRWKEAPGGHGARVAPAGGKTARVALGVALAAPGGQTARVAPAGGRLARVAPAGGSCRAGKRRDG